jgi:hypothetical protein
MMHVQCGDVAFAATERKADDHDLIITSNVGLGTVALVPLVRADPTVE